MRKAISWIDINKNKEIILTKKNEVWILPWGKPDGDEDDITCFKRECEEELAWTQIIVEKYYKDFEWITPYKGDILLNKTYFIKVIADVLQSSWEIKEVHRVNKENLYKYTLSNITQKIVQNLIQDNYL